MAKYLFKKNDKVWAMVNKFSRLPWRKGIILSRFKRNYKNVYNVSPFIGKHGFEIIEKALQKA